VRAAQCVNAPAREGLERTHDFGQRVSCRGGSKTRPLVGRSETCPYSAGNHNDSVDVIGHDNERVKSDVGVMIRQVIPARLDSRAEGLKTDLAANDVAQDTLVVLDADGHEISTGLGVVVALQADGSATMLLNSALHVTNIPSLASG